MRLKEAIEITATAVVDATFTDAWQRWMLPVLSAHQRAADDDGGMHIAGVEILLAFENGATVDDCMMQMFV